MMRNATGNTAIRRTVVWLIMVDTQEQARAQTETNERVLCFLFSVV